MKKEITDIINPETVENKATQKNSIEARKRQLDALGLKFKKPDFDYSMKKKLDLPQSVMSFFRENNLHPRWVDESRIPMLEEQGYAVIPKTTFKGEDVSVRRHVGRNSEGSPHYQVLMATPLEMFAERQARKEELNQLVVKERSDEAKDVGYQSGVDMGLKLNQKNI